MRQPVHVLSMFILWTSLNALVAPAFAKGSADCKMVHSTPISLEDVPRKYLSEDRTVRVKVYVDSTGRAQKVIVVNGVPGSGLDVAVTRAAMDSTYQSGLQDGKPVAGWVIKDYRLVRQ